MPCGGIQVQPGCCCSVAFESSTAFMVGTGAGGCLGNNYMTNALSPENIGNLGRYRLLFMGPNNACGGTWYQLTTAQNLAVRSWVEAGGRLFAAAEYYDCFTVANFDRYNTFLGVLGSSMQMTADIPGGCNSGCDPRYSGVPRPVPIMAGLSGVWHSAAGKVIGGTQICRITPTAAPCNDAEISFINAEKIGDGIVFACIDSNVTSFCGDVPNPNCEFFLRMCNWSVSAMLPA